MVKLVVVSYMICGYIGGVVILGVGRYWIRSIVGGC